MPVWIQHALVVVIVAACAVILVRQVLRSSRHGGKHCEQCPSHDQHRPGG